LYCRTAALRGFPDSLDAVLQILENERAGAGNGHEGAPLQSTAVLSPRPRDAATLILLRRSHGDVEVLMGRRASRDAWSDRYVFPGGRVDPRDSRVATATPLRPEVERRLCLACSPPRARALAVAAIRETFEETGLVLGKPLPVPTTVPGDWRGFLDRGLAPALDELGFLCRAITPPRRPRRFNARFFLADARALRGDIRGNGELRDIRWVSLDQASELPLPAITTAVLGELRAHLDSRRRPARTPLFKTVRGRHLRLHE
jgi:8-oxo-dGTP pyrophosphatase MutT (NUDIX family)